MNATNLRIALRPCRTQYDTVLPVLPHEVHVDDTTGEVVAVYLESEDVNYPTLSALSAEHAVSIEELLGEDDCAVLRVRPSTTVDTAGAVDAEVLVRVGDEVVEAEVTLCPDPGRPSVGRRHPLDTWGTLDAWASDNLARAIEQAEESLDDYDRHGTMREIVAYVREAAEAL